MKAFTDTEQSKKLAEILPLESADMFWYRDAVTKENNPRIMSLSQVPNNKSMYYFPCWSFAALLNVIPISYKDEGQYCFALINTNPSANPVEWRACYEDCYGNMLMESYADNPVDACVDMIIKLKESNLL